MQLYFLPPVILHSSVDLVSFLILRVLSLFLIRTLVISIHWVRQFTVQTFHFYVPVYLPSYRRTLANICMARTPLLVQVMIFSHFTRKISRILRGLLHHLHSAICMFFFYQFSNINKVCYHSTHERWGFIILSFQLKLQCIVLLPRNIQFIVFHSVLIPGKVLLLCS